MVVARRGRTAAAVVSYCFPFAVVTVAGGSAAAAAAAAILAGVAFAFALAFLGGILIFGEGKVCCENSEKVGGQWKAEGGSWQSTRFCKNKKANALSRDVLSFETAENGRSWLSVQASRDKA